MITGLPVTFESPERRRTAPGRLPPVRCPRRSSPSPCPSSGGLPGDHLFVLSKETALKIASLANKDETLSELDDMAISAVQECVSTLTGTADHRRLREDRQPEHPGRRRPRAPSGPRPWPRFPTGDFLRAIYQCRSATASPRRWSRSSPSPSSRTSLAASGGAPGRGPAPQAAWAPQQASRWACSRAWAACRASAGHGRQQMGGSMQRHAA